MPCLSLWFFVTFVMYFIKVCSATLGKEIINNQRRSHLPMSCQHFCLPKKIVDKVTNLLQNLCDKNRPLISAWKPLEKHLACEDFCHDDNYKLSLKQYNLHHAFLITTNIFTFKNYVKKECTQSSIAWQVINTDVMDWMLKSASDHLNLWLSRRVFLIIPSDAALHDRPEVADQSLYMKNGRWRRTKVLVKNVNQYLFEPQSMFH